MQKQNRLFRGLSFFFVAFCVATSAVAQTADFNGSWQIDKTKTNFNGAPEFVLPKGLKVTQSDASLVIDRTTTNAAQEEKHYLEQVTFDGKSSQTLTANGNSETDTLSWGGDKASIILAIGAKSPDGNLLLNATETWSLTGNGNTLVIDRQVKQAGGMSYSIKGYFSKQ